MIEPRFLQALFVDTFEAINQQLEGITHSDSVKQPPFGGNCIHWILGHLVVARCNFLMLLDVPSIWDMPQCRRCIPGSVPVTGESNSVPLDSLLADLDRTQELLLIALARVPMQDILLIKQDQTIGEHLVSYYGHESYHLGQLEILRQMVDKEGGV